MTASKSPAGRIGAIAAVSITSRFVPDTVKKIDAWIARQSEPQPSRAEAVRRLVDRGLQGIREDAADARAARVDEGRAEAARARLDHQNAQNAEIEKTARLRLMRLAKEEHDRRIASGEQKPPKRAPGAHRAKELAVDAVRDALGKVDAPIGEKIGRGKKLVKRPPGLERK